MADSAAIFKIVKSPHVSEKSSDFDNMWYTTADIEPDDSNVTKNYFFLNSRWWIDGRCILKIVFLAVTHQPIVRSQRNFVRGSIMRCASTASALRG